MKLYRNAIILIIILALLFGVYLFVTNKKGKDSPQDTRNFEKIIDLDTFGNGRVNNREQRRKTNFH
jgi:hypothetical protein